MLQLQSPYVAMPLTEPISGDDYVRVVLTGRQDAWVNAWQAEHPGMRLRFPPPLDKFVAPGDEEFVILPEESPKPAKPATKPRVYRSAESLRAERDNIEAQMAAVANDGMPEDGAVVNLSPHSRSRAARTAGRRRFAQMDRALERYGRLRTRRDQLNGQIVRAEARERRDAANN